MKTTWKEMKLGDCIDIISGYGVNSTDYLKEGIPLIKIKNIKPPYVDLDDVDYVSEDYLEDKKRYILKKGDVLISLTGSNVNQMNSAVGKVGRIKFDNIAFLNQRVGKIVVTDENKFDLNLIYYILSTKEMNYNLAIRASGSANQANINPSIIKNIKIKLPNYSTQKKIGYILDKIDQKIELNNKINNNNLKLWI